MKINLKKILLVLLYYLFRNIKDNRLLVLNYHRITNVPDYNDPLKVSKNIFEKQIYFLKENYNIITGDELLDIIRNKKPIPNKACLLTFDDGWRDNYTNAYPILKKYDVPAIIFISTDYVGTNNIFWHEQLQELLNSIPVDLDIITIDKVLADWPNKIRSTVCEIIKQPKSKRQLIINELITMLKPFNPKKINNLIIKLSKQYKQELIDEPLVLSWDEIHEMSKNNIYFGSHTKSHAILTQIEEDKLNQELNESKRILEKWVEKPIYYFSYPNGNYNEKIANSVKDAGYIAAFAMVSGKIFSNNNLYEIERNMIKEQSSRGINGEFSELLFKVELSGIRNRIKHNIFNKNI